MEPKVLADILTRHLECARDGDHFQVPDHAGLTVLAGTGNEAIAIERVRQIQLEHALLLAETRRGERFVILCQDVRGLRMTGSSGIGPGY